MWACLSSIIRRLCFGFAADVNMVGGGDGGIDGGGSVTIDGANADAAGESGHDDGKARGGKARGGCGEVAGESSLLKKRWCPSTVFGETVFGDGLFVLTLEGALVKRLFEASAVLPCEMGAPDVSTSCTRVRPLQAHWCRRGSTPSY